MVQHLQSVVQDKARNVCKHMQEGIEKSLPVDLHHAFRAVSVDVISDFAFNKSYDFLEKEDLGAYFFLMARGIGPALTLLTEADKPDGYRVPSTMDWKDEAYPIFAAASDTTGNAMTIATFNVLSNPQIYQTLVRELENVFPDPNAELQFDELEIFWLTEPLTAILETGATKEALRLSFGVIGRLPRVVPDSGTIFNSYFVPGGTIVGMSA